MITFNILGDCVSRDIIVTLEKSSLGGVKVLQYQGLSNPIAVCSPKGDIKLQLDDFTGGNQTITAFRKRCIVNDVNKTILDYVFKKKSDYFILDIVDARLPLLKKGDFCFTKDLHMKLDEMPDYLQLDTYEEMDPFTDISMEQWMTCIDQLADVIQKHYTRNQIILNIHYGVKKYVDKAVLKEFKASALDYVDTYNPLVHTLFDRLQTNLKGCHVIEFPEHVIADKRHWFGLLPLHYHNIYYRYAAEAVKVILSKLPDYEEKAKLGNLRDACSERFEAMQTKLEFSIVKRKSEWCNHALSFTSELALDLLGDGCFTKWLEKNREKKVAVLKYQDIAGQILLKGLDKYGFDIVFSTQAATFDKLTEEQMALCREADIVISANVHSAVVPQREGIKAVCISDLLKKQKGLSD